MAIGAVESDPKAARASPRSKIRLSPVGFWSYSRHDDEFSRGRLSQLRSLLLAELRTQYGRDGLQLFQDVSAIAHGADWERITTGAIDESTFFIPIVTPFYMQSEWCARETRLFEARERAIFDTYPDLSRDRRRIFPLLWIDVSEIEPVDEAAMAAIRAAQWCDFSNLRHRNLEQDEQVLAHVAAFAKSIVDVLQLRVEAPLTEEEKEQSARKVEEAQLQAQQKQERLAAEAREAERQAVIEAERCAAEKERRRAEREVEEGRLRAEQEAEERAAAEQRERETAARREQELKLAAEREQQAVEWAREEAEREAERRARREANLARFASLDRSKMLWIVLGAAVVLFLVGLWNLRPSREGADGNVATVMENPGGSAAADANMAAAADAADVAMTNAAAAGSELSIAWLLHRWCVGGNRANVQEISGDRTRITIAFGNDTQSEAVRGIEEGLVTTEIASYRREGEALVIAEGPRQQRLQRCG